MHEEKHKAALSEVEDSIGEAIKSPSLLNRQRLLMSAMSLGMQHLIELWLHKSKAIKPGATIKHEIFKSELKRLKERLVGMLTKQIDTLKNADKILEIARTIEINRDDIIYGSPLNNDQILREKINLFFELKKEIIKTVGEI